MRGSQAFFELDDGSVAGRVGNRQIVQGEKPF